MGLEKTYKNSDVRTILNIPMRRIVNFTDKELVIPVVDARGAGSKREYNERNLLEFILIEELLEVGFGIRKVKNIMDDLRHDDLRDTVHVKLSEYSDITINAGSLFKKRMVPEE